MPVALLKKLIHRYFLKSLTIDFKIPIFTERLSVVASKIYKFVTTFFQNAFSTSISQKIGRMYKF